MKKLEGIKVKGHRGTWYVIDTTFHKGVEVFLLESEQYGEDAASVIVDGKNNVILEDVLNGFQDLREAAANE